MGYDASAVTFLGVRLDEAWFSQKQKGRGCKHPLPEHARTGNSKFCSECGKPLWATKVLPRPGFEDFDDDPEVCGKSAGLILCRVSEEGTDYVFGVKVARTSCNDKCVKSRLPTDEKVAATRQGILVYLIKAGIREEDASKLIADTFGLYTILDESY